MSPCGADPDRLLIFECSPYFPRTRALEGHAHTLRLDEVDVIVDTEARPTVLPDEPGTARRLSRSPRTRRRLFTDGSTLQTGIGAVPNLVAQALVQRYGGDYGVHSEMFTDGLYALARWRAKSPTHARPNTTACR